LLGASRHIPVSLSLRRKAESLRSKTPDPGPRRDDGKPFGLGFLDAAGLMKKGI